MPSTALLTLLCAVAFAAIHILTPRLTFIRAVPRSRWLSFAGGVAVAYVFMHILPELAEHENALAEEGAGLVVYALSLGGLVVFYGLERRIRAARARHRQTEGRDRADNATFWLHIGSFGVYNVLVGYLLLHREENDAGALALYFVALGLHFFTTDFGLNQDHRELYRSPGRWVLAAAVLFGWALGVAVDVPEVGVIAFFSFLAGGVVLNVLKEELPEERQSRFAPFLLGAAAYAAVLAIA